MAVELRVIRVFLASPSDVKAERRVALDVQSRVNGIALDRGSLVHLMMWEQVLPEAGRPQEVINRMVDTCDRFTGLLHKRWGIKTGRYSSGFEEEFARAAKRYRATGAPDISIFFKTPSRAALATPTSELDKVLGFKRKHAQKVLYSEFKTTEQWRNELFALLLRDVTAPEAPDRADAVTHIVAEVVRDGVVGAEIEQMKVRLAGAINRLGDREKIVLTLNYYEGLTVDEIAEVLGVTSRSVRQIHTTAIRHLRSQMVA